MYWISIDASFNASHQLAFADGTREPLHAHRWAVTAAVCSDVLDEQGLVMDFLDLQRAVQAVLADFEAKQLENTPIFAGRNASAEAVAKALYDRIAPYIPAPARLGYIEVTEAAGCRARYAPSGQ